MSIVQRTIQHHGETYEMNNNKIEWKLSIVQIVQCYLRLLIFSVLGIFNKIQSKTIKSKCVIIQNCVMLLAYCLAIKLCIVSGSLNSLSIYSIMHGMDDEVRRWIPNEHNEIRKIDKRWWFRKQILIHWHSEVHKL